MSNSTQVIKQQNEEARAAWHAYNSISGRAGKVDNIVELKLAGVASSVKKICKTQQTEHSFPTCGTLAMLARGEWDTAVDLADADVRQQAHQQDEYL